MSSGAAARRNYGAAKPGPPQEEAGAEEDERTEEEMLQEIERLDKEDVRATRRMLALATETRDIGAKTAATLKDQGEQIERTGNMLTGMDESLRSLGGRLGSAFGWRKKKKDKASKKGQPASPGAGPAAGPAAPSPALEGKSMSTPVMGSSVRTARDRMAATQRPASGRAPGYRPGPNAAESEAAQAEIDGNLDAINNLVLEMKAEAEAMGQELEKQNKALKKIDQQATVNGEGVKSATHAMTKRNWVGGIKKIEGKMKAAAASYATGGAV